MKHLWKNNGFRIGVALFGATALPIAIYAGYISTAATQAGRNFTDEVNMLWLSVAAGLTFVAMLPIKVFWRVLLGILYIPVVSGVLAAWLLIYVCGRFHACL